MVARLTWFPVVLATVVVAPLAACYDSRWGCVWGSWYPPDQGHAICVGEVVLADGGTRDLLSGMWCGGVARDGDMLPWSSAPHQDCCYIDDIEAGSGYGVIVDVVETVNGPGVILVPETAIPITEEDLARGEACLSPTESVLELCMGLADLHGYVTVSLTRLTVARDDHGRPWDEDGSPPDIEVGLLSADGARNVVRGEGWGFEESQYVTLVPRTLLLAEGLTLSVVENDDNAWVVRHEPVLVTDEDARNREKVVRDVHGAWEVHLDIRVYDKLVCD